MRVAYVVHKYPPESLGGTEIYTWTLARHMRDLGHEVHVFYPLPGLSPDTSRIERDGLRLWRVPLPAQGPRNVAARYWATFRSRPIERAFGRFLTETRPELIHYQHLQGVSAKLVSMAAGLPRVMTLHDYWYFCANSQLVLPDWRICTPPYRGARCATCGLSVARLGGIRWLAPLLGLPFGYRNDVLAREIAQIDAFIAPSRFLRGQYVARGIDPARITAIEHGLDTDRIAPTDGPLSPPPGQPHFMFLGSIARHKGLHVLIEAFNRLPEHVGLTIHGDADVFPEYTASLRAMARHPRIRFGGPLDHRHVGDALRQADYLVVPSLWHETYCLVIQEAMGVGTPAVASRMGAMTERIRDGVDGRLFEAGNADELERILRELIAHPELHERYRANIRPVDTMAAHAKKVAGVYGRVMAARGNGRIEENC